MAQSPGLGFRGVKWNRRQRVDLGLTEFSSADKNQCPRLSFRDASKNWPWELLLPKGSSWKAQCLSLEQRYLSHHSYNIWKEPAVMDQELKLDFKILKSIFIPWGLLLARNKSYYNENSWKQMEHHFFSQYLNSPVLLHDLIQGKDSKPWRNVGIRVFF